MFEELGYIELSGERYPIKCDMVVLEKIQDKYGNMSEFENGLTGFVPEKEITGEYKRNEDGYLLGRYYTPEIRMINDALYWMAKEGAEIEAEIESKQTPKIDREKLIRKVNIPPKEIGRLLHEEFQRCFERKNENATQSKK